MIGCLEKSVGIVKKELFTFLLCLLKICMRERRLRIRILERDLKDFLVDIALYEGLALGPFSIISDEFTNDMEDEIPW